MTWESFGIGLAAAAALALAAPTSGGTVQQSGPSFDCAAASGQVETLICEDEGLAALDRRMTDVYETAMTALPADEVATERAMQRGWIGGRNECWMEDDVRGCTELSYRTRIVELQIKSGQLVVPTPVGYACEGVADQPVTATFYPDTEPATAVITVGNDQVIAFQQPMASGVRYTADGVEFQEHQGEVTLIWFGSTFTCRARDTVGR